MRRWEHDALRLLPKPWRNLGEAIASGRQGGRWLGHPVVRPRSGRCERATAGLRAAGAAGPSAVRLPRAQPYPRVPARRADRRAVARGPARRGRQCAECAAFQTAARTRRRRPHRPRRVTPEPRRPRPGRHRALSGRDPRVRGGDGSRRPRRRRPEGPRRARPPTCRRSCRTPRAAGPPSSGASWRRSGCAHWRRSPRRDSGRVGASWGRPSRRRARRSPRRRSASRRTGC